MQYFELFPRSLLTAHIGIEKCIYGQSRALLRGISNSYLQLPTNHRESGRLGSKLATQKIVDVALMRDAEHLPRFAFTIHKLH